MRVENQRLLVSFIFCLVLVQLASSVKADFSEQLYQRGLLELRSGRTESATHLFRQSIEADDNFAKSHGAIGTIYLQTGELDLAERHLLKAVELDGYLEQAQLNLAHLYKSTNRTNLAISNYNHLVEQPVGISPTSQNRAYIGLATIYHQRSDYSKAITFYQEALKVSASVPSVITNLAACYEATNQLDQAIKSYKSALEIDSNLPMALGNLGAIYQGQGNIQQAFPLLEKAVQVDPSFFEARYHIGLILMKQKQFSAAVSAFETVIKQKADHVGAHYNLAQGYFRLRRAREGRQTMDVYRQLKAIATEIEDRERAITIEPNNPAVHYRLGKIYEKYNKIDLALSAYQSAVAVGNHYSEAHYALGRIYFQSGRLVAAKKSYQTALKYSPQTAAPHLGLAKIFHFQQKSDLAEKHYRAVLQQAEANQTIAGQTNPTLALAQAGLGTIYLQKKDHQKAVLAFQKALASNPKAHYAMIGLAQVYLKKNTENDQACLLAEQACQLQPVSEYFDILAQVYHQAGKIKLALKACQLAIESAPDNPVFQQRLAELQKDQAKY